MRQFSSYLIIFIAATLAAKQKWQDVASPQLEEIFCGTNFNLSAFYYAKDIKEVCKLCEKYSTKVKKTASYNSSLAATECKKFFNHRIQVQQWVDKVFKDMTKYGLSKYTSAELKSYIWWVDAHTYNDFITTLHCFLEHYQNPFSAKVWKKMNSSWTLVMEEMNSTPLANEVVSYSMERLVRFSQYGISKTITPPCNL